jgi:hypothetical protein
MNNWVKIQETSASNVKSIMKMVKIINATSNVRILKKIY